MGGAVEKQFLSLKGIPILVHTLRVFDRCPVVDGVILVVGAGRRQTVKKDILDPYGFDKIIGVVNGGKKRQESVANGLESVPQECELVVVHDGVRPLVSIELLIKVVEAGRDYGAALAAVQPRDTVKQTEGKRVTATLDREAIWLAQTPQAFHTNLLRRAHSEAAKGRIEATDDAALVERLGAPVHVVPGSAENIKVTTPSDLIVVEGLMRQGDIGGEELSRNEL
jgi:2-C-methyl-D-erythritol 4-phosphate cytidylyltransferase